MKKMTSRTLFFSLLCVPCLSLAMYKPAASADNIYIFGQLGYSSSLNSNFGLSDNGTGYANPSRNISGNFGNSIMYGAAVGYHFSPLIRAELAYNARPNFNYDHTFADPATDRKREFDISDQTLMFNLYLDGQGLNRFSFGRFNPYVGAGIGNAWNKTGNEHSYIASTGAPVGGPLIAGTTVSSFAWQVMIGTMINMTSHLGFDLGYRYLNLGHVSLADHHTDGTFFAPGMPYAKLRATSAQTQEVFLGLNYRFG